MVEVRGGAWVERAGGRARLKKYAAGIAVLFAVHVGLLAVNSPCNDRLCVCSVLYGSSDASVNAFLKIAVVHRLQCVLMLKSLNLAGTKEQVLLG